MRGGWWLYRGDMQLRGGCAQGTGCGRDLQGPRGLGGSSPRTRLKAHAILDGDHSNAPTLLNEDWLVVGDELAELGGFTSTMAHAPLKARGGLSRSSSSRRPQLEGGGSGTFILPER